MANTESERARLFESAIKAVSIIMESCDSESETAEAVAIDVANCMVMLLEVWESKRVRQLQKMAVHWRDIDSEMPTTGFIAVWSPKHPFVCSVWEAELFHEARKTTTPNHLSGRHFTKWTHMPLPESKESL